MIKTYLGHIVQVLDDDGVCAVIVDSFGDTIRVLSNLLK